MADSKDSENTQGFVQLSANALLREIEGETVLLDLGSEAYFSLDEIGTDILRVVQKQPDLKHAVRVLVELYDVDEQTLETDIRRLLNELRQEGLIVGQW